MFSVLWYNFLMSFKKIFAQLNIFSQCKQYCLPLWQCPQFLFLIMGLMTCFTSVASFIIGTRFIDDPAIVALIILFTSAFFIVIAFLIIRSFERLAEANRMKSEFIGVVSHQLRSPLSNLSWALDALMSGRLGLVQDKQTEYLAILRENTGRMKELISDLIIVSRIENATLPMKKEMFCLETEVKKLMHRFEPFADAYNVELKIKVEKKAPLVFADPKQVEQVIENLLDNAIRYTKHKGSINITIKTQGKNVRCEIADKGIGIPKNDQKFIFKKFFRSKNILKHEIHGSGLGLFIAKSIIERSRGKIGFNSIEGEGTIFWFTLPTKL